MAGPVAAAGAGRSAKSSAGIVPLPHQIEIGREHDDDAGNNHLQVLVPAQNDDAVVDDVPDTLEWISQQSISDLCSESTIAAVADVKKAARG